MPRNVSCQRLSLGGSRIYIQHATYSAIDNMLFLIAADHVDVDVEASRRNDVAWRHGGSSDARAQVDRPRSKDARRASAGRSVTR